MNDADEHKQRPEGSFTDEASKQVKGWRAGIAGEFIGFMREYAKWWLTPIVIVFLAVAALLIFGTTTGGLPFIYTLF